MLEHLKNQLVEDQSLALQAAESEVPFRNLSIQAKGIGNLVLANQMASTANDASSLYLDGHLSLGRSISADAETTAEIQVPLETAEKKVYDAETIDGILNSTCFANKYYLDKSGEDTTVVSKGEKAMSVGRINSRDYFGDGAARTVASLISGRKRYETAENQAYEAAGIAEVVSLIDPATEVDALKNEFNYTTIRDNLASMSGSQLNGEPIKVLHYKIVSGRGNFKYPDPSGRTGAQSEFVVILPATEAEGLFEAMQTNPNLVRTINEAMILKALDGKLYGKGRNSVSQSDVDPNDPSVIWENRRPPYDVWKQNENGVARMAFRSRIQAGPSDSTVVEF